jgi:uncharacterized repeat protein (TIGR01451 family)/gliding motility-associated-like protein
MKKRLLFLVSFLFYTLFGFSQTPAAPSLNAAQEFGVLAGASVINTGPTLVYAKVGVSPGTTIDGFPDGLALGELFRNDADAIQAQVDANKTYNFLNAFPQTKNLPDPIVLGNGISVGTEQSNGMVVYPGVYKFAGDASIFGKLVLDGAPDEIFVFQIPGNLEIVPGSFIDVQNGAQARNVFFVVGGSVQEQASATPGTPSQLTGNMLAKGNLNIGSGSTLNGRLLGLSATSVVTLNANNIALPTIVQSDLSISKTISSGPYTIGAEVTYTITLRNQGPSAANNVRITEKLSASLDFVSFTPSRTGITFDQTTGIIQVGQMANGETIILTIKARINAAGAINNKVVVDANEPDEIDENDEDEVIVVVPPLSTDLSVLKTITPVKSAYNVGENITYTITARNNGPDNATNVVVNDLLPASLTLRSFTVLPAGGNYDPATGIYSINNLANGQTAVLTIVATINQPGQIINTATISGGQADQVPDNNTSTVIISAEAVPIADLGVKKTVSAGPYNLNGEITYTIVVRNNGPDGATGVVVNETLPPSVVYLSHTITQGMFSATNGQYLVGNLANGQTATLTITVRLISTGTIRNEVSVGGNEIDPNPGDNDNDEDGDDEDEVEICVLPPAPLAITGPASVCPDQTNLVYEVPAIPGALSYTYTMPAGWVITAGAGTNTIVVKAGNAGGLISVVANVSCGTGPATSLAVSVGAPATAGEIRVTGGSATACSGTQVIFSIDPVVGASSYRWTVPADWTILSGQNTTSITTVSGNTAGEVTVAAVNACGPGTAKTIAVTPVPTPAAPAAIADNSSPCVGALTYSFVPVAGLTYTWSVSAGFTIDPATQGQATVKLLVQDPLMKTGTLSLTASNGTCSSAVTTFDFDATKAGTDLFFPNAFSPNGDGNYDNWIVKNILNFADNEVMIYNRWGNEVYRRKNYRNEWTAQGLEQGTYFYVFQVKECNGAYKTHRGYVTVYR